MAARRVDTKLDLENLAEEVESLGRSDLNTVRSQVRRIIEHLLKLEHSPASEPRIDWRSSVAQARDEIEDHITASMFAGRCSRPRQALRASPARCCCRTHQAR